MSYIPVRPLTPEQSLREAQAIGKAADKGLEYINRPQQGLFGGLTEGLEGASKGFFGEQKYTVEDVRQKNPTLDAILKGAALPAGPSTTYKAPEPQTDAVNLAFELATDPVDYLGGFLGVGAKATKETFKRGAEALKNINVFTKNKRKGQALGSAPNVISDYYVAPVDQMFPAGTTPESVRKAILSGKDVPEQARKAYDAWNESSFVGLMLEQLTNTYGRLEDGSKAFHLTEKVASRIPSNIKQAVAKLQEKGTENSRAKANAMLSAYFAGTGFAQWGGKSLSNALKEIFDPVSTARYIETGLTSTNQKRINSLFNNETQKHHVTGRDLPKSDKASTQEAIAQLQHATYMAHRAGRVDFPEVLQETLDQMSVGGFRKFSPNEFKEATNSVKMTLNNTDYKVPENVSDALFEKAHTNWAIGKNDDITMVVRQPSGESGHFSHDVNMKSSGVRQGRKIFADNPQGFSTPEQLREAYIKAGVPKNSVVIKGDAVLVTNSSASVSKLEGGINIVTYVDLKGRSHTVISDLYDFLENIPVVRKIEENLENVVWGITPPIPQDLRVSKQFTTERTVPENIPKLKQLTKDAEPKKGQVAVEATRILAKTGATVAGVGAAGGMFGDAIFGKEED